MKTVAILALLVLNCINASAYTVIIPSTSTPAGTEQALIAQTTTYFNASVLTNPLFPGTYQITLYGPAKSDFQILRDSGTYPFVWGEGVEYQRGLDVQNIIGAGPYCNATPYCLGVSSMTVPGDFTVGGSTYTVTVDSTTCVALACRIASDIYEQGFAAPPIAPPPP